MARDLGKAAGGILSYFARHRTAANLLLVLLLLAGVYTIPNAPGHAGADPEELAETARQFLPKAEAYASLEAALEAAAAAKPDRILIGGSLYIAGEVLEKNDQRPT